MKKIYLSLISILSILLLAGCSDGASALDKEDIGDLDQDAVFENPIHAKYFVADIYYNIPETGFQVYDKWEGAYLDCATDNGEARHLTSRAHHFNNGNMTAMAHPMASTVWARGYAGIRSCNRFLENYHKIIPEEGIPELRRVEMESLKAQVTFLRAYHYAYLLKGFGGVPIIDQVYEDNDPALLKPRATFEETVNYIVKECKQAELMFEDLASKIDLYGESTLGRANDRVAKALKAKVLLIAASPLFNRPTYMPQYDSADPNAKYWKYTDYQESRWADAADALKEVIDLNQFSLYQNAEITKNAYETYFTKREVNETIFAFLRGSNIDIYHANLPFEFMNVRGKGSPMCYNLPSHNLVASYEMNNGMLPEQDGSGYRPLNPFANRDPRLNATIWHDESQYSGIEFQTWRRETSSKKTSGKHYIKGYSRSGYYLKKYMDADQDARNNGVTLPNIYPIIRYADILLMYAEALNESNATPPTEAIAAINEVRNRAGMPDVEDSFTNRGWALDQDNLRKLIMNERRVEFAFEEHRFWDIRRWMIGEATQRSVSELEIILKDDDLTKEYSVKEIEKRAYSNYMNLMPVPHTEIVKNKNLVQNWGWAPGSQQH